MTNLVFIHGVNEQVEGYSRILCELIFTQYKKILLRQGLGQKEVDDRIAQLIPREFRWEDMTKQLTDGYAALEYGPKKKAFFWDLITKKADPLVIQILFYVKDKGDKATGAMHILERVHNKFEEYHKGDTKRCIIVAHSLGSVIAFDYVFGFRKYKLNPEVTVEALITFGSPIPIFTSAMGHVESDLKLPSYVKRWVNILDKEDGVARYCKPFFKNIELREIEVNTGILPIRSHSGYWRNKRTAGEIARVISEIGNK